MPLSTFYKMGTYELVEEEIIRVLRSVMPRIYMKIHLLVGK